jgi:hypothetical protein
MQLLLLLLSLYMLSAQAAIYRSIKYHSWKGDCDYVTAVGSQKAVAQPLRLTVSEQALNLA